MRIQLIAAGTRMPAWVSQGFAEYANRLPRDYRLELIEIPLGRRTPSAPPERARQTEGERLLAAVTPGARIVALDERGQLWNTRELAARLADWQMEGRDLALLIGGPDGLDSPCKQRAEQLWSLSPLTFPHALARVIVVEQLYRAWSILNRHPYHRE